MPAQKTRSRKAASAPSKKPASAPSKKPAPARMSLAEVMRALEKAGTAQTRKTYTRHGASGPMFGVLFSTLAGLVKKIGVDHDLALGLWGTGNFDARNLAFKIADPARLTPAELDRWARDTDARMCAIYVSMLAAEGPHGLSTATRWLAADEERLRCAGWGLVAQLAARDEATPDAWFADRLAEIQKTIHDVGNAERGVMNQTVIAIGGRSPALKKAVLAAAKRIGKVEVDHGDTSCKTPDAASYVEKMWTHAKSKGFASPSAQERERESPRTRC